MLGLAVGIDYSLLITSRHRTQLAAGVAVRESVAVAISTAGTAVVFAGLTVMIALLGLACALVAGCTSTSSSTDASLTPTMSTASLGTATSAVDAVSAAMDPTAEDLYYLEFRARTAESYGHTFAMFGQRNAQGQILTR